MTKTPLAVVINNEKGVHGDRDDTRREQGNSSPQLASHFLEGERAMAVNP
jgi:hypothetical protein